MNKQDVMLMIQERAATLKKLQEENSQIETTIQRYVGMERSLNPNQLAAYEQAKQVLNRNRGIMESLDWEIKRMMEDLSESGNEEIYVAKEANVPIIPTYTTGEYGSGKTRVVIGEKIYVNDLYDKNLSEKENINNICLYFENYVKKLGEIANEEKK